MRKSRKKYTLTDDHRAELWPWATRWARNALSTAAMTDADRAICRDAMHGLYRAAGFDPPRCIEFVSSPFGLLETYVRHAEAWRMRYGLGPTVYVISNAISDAVNRKIADAIYDSVSHSTCGLVWSEVGHKVNSATDGATCTATQDAIGDTLGLDPAAKLARWFVPGVPMPARDRMPSYMGNIWQSGNQLAGNDAFISFFRHVAQLDIDFSAWQHWESLALHSGPRIVLPGSCIVSDRPDVLRTDALRRPHCDTGPFCHWRDGSALYSVHGVRVPAWIIEQPRELTAEKIETEPSARIRRVMYDRLRARSDHQGGA